MKIKVKLFKGGKMPQINSKGDLFDVFSRKKTTLKAPQVVTNNITFDYKVIPLGFAMEIPTGFKANLYPRSSTYKKWHIIFGNHVGQIDSSFGGDKDEWLVSAISFNKTTIKEGDKIAQFEIVPSSKATIWQKVKWLFSNKIEFVEVDCLNNINRGGFGSTGSR